MSSLTDRIGARRAISRGLIAPKWRPLWLAADCFSLCRDIGAFDHKNRRIGTANGTPANFAGKIGPAIDLDGDGDYIGFPAFSNSQTDITIACVYESDEYSGPRAFLDTSATTNGGFRLQWVGSTSSLSFILGAVAEYGLFSGPVVGRPYFFAVTYVKATGAVKGWLRQLHPASNIVSTATATASTSPRNGDGTIAVGGTNYLSNISLNGRMYMAYVGRTVIDPDLMAAWARDPFGPFRMADEAGAVYPVAAGGANPKGPLGMPFHGPFGGPLSV